VCKQNLPDNFYERIGPRLYRRIGRELRLARRVLDIGCGPCDLVRYLSEAYEQDVTGVDISSERFPGRRRLRQGRRFRCLRRDAGRLLFVDDRSMDAVVMLWALHEMERPEAVLSEIARVLRPGGEVLIVDFPRGSLQERIWKEDFYRPAEVEQLFAQAGLADIRVRLIERQQVLWGRAYRPPAETSRT